MIVSHLLLILHKKIQFYIFMFEAWNVAKGRKVQGGRILSQGTVYPQQNKSYIDITWKAAQQGRSHCFKTAIKKPDYSLQLHMGINIVIVLEMSSGLMKQK